MGELIPITLEFSSGSPDKYRLNGATYDRSGRLPTEEFVTERDDITDPYVDYFGVMGGFAGGLRGYPVLSAEAYSIELNLTDWFRFDKPGEYRLYLKSHRVQRERRADEPGDTRTVLFAAVSNVIEIEILPRDEAWETSKLAEIRAILDRPPTRIVRARVPGEATEPYDPASEERFGHARSELRTLGIPRSVGLMLDRARGPGEQVDSLLLVGARDRADSIAQFDRYLTDPIVEFSAWEIRLRALFTFVQKEAPKPLPFFGWQVDKDGQSLEQLRKIAEARHQRLEVFVTAEATRLVPILSRKTTDARKACAEAIAQVAPEMAKAAGLVPPDDYGLTREELIAGFAGFPEEQQSSLLYEKWDLVRGPEMIPVLRGLVAKAPPQPLPESAMSLHVWVPVVRAEQALRRLRELAPEEAEGIIREDLARKQPRFAGYAVREFPAQEVPSADSVFLKLLDENLHGVLPLVAKFGGANLTDKIRTIYANPEKNSQWERWDCAAEQAFVTFFVRVDPEGGADVLRRAMANRKERGCYRMLLGQVARDIWNRAMEGQALVSLGDSDAETVASAADVLAHYGGREIQPALWKRLEQWSEKWRGREAELAGPPIRSSGLPHPEDRLGDALFNALENAKSWVLDVDARARLNALCVTDWCRKRLSARDTASISVSIHEGGGSYPTRFVVDGYHGASLDDLKAKLSQFPVGTRFAWCSPEILCKGLTDGQRKEIFDELSEFVRARSMAIEQ
jgi:hypothetical protein